ncbi:MAG: asparagine synthase (glutamine-hydrolyzing) [Magnetococcales bacterium]|nr:asparagine synthase (glutamine-hydrolyzing) [Magnetococcales bacterium]
MCGITGFLDPSCSRNNYHLQATAKAMANCIANRGPDDSGEWVDETFGVALAHRRLSIIDLSPLGHQPMVSQSGRYIVVYNGEIYNFPELRKELSELGCIFRGHSDTEIMLAAIETWGLTVSINKFIGMFAFALWDQDRAILHLVRDRLGIKPLYYGWVDGCFVFASELKSLKGFSDKKLPINRDALALYMRHNYVPAPHSIFKNIYKLLPGNILTIDSKQSDIEPKITNYWSAKDIVYGGLDNQFSGSDNEAIKSLEKILGDAVAIRMVADVDLGAFLSGGYDSSLVVALMQARSERKVKTFSIGFNEDAYNEAHFAKEVARHLGTQHTELYITPQEAMGVIPQLPTLYDEPFSDSSQIPTFLVSQLARKHVTVSLSGDGGDELFAGYHRYDTGERIWNKFGWLHPSIRSSLAAMMGYPSTQTYDKIFGLLNPLLPQQIAQKITGDRVHKLGEILQIKTRQDFYRRLVSHWKDPLKIVKDSHEPLSAFSDPTRQADLDDFTQYMMYTDLISYLPDDILTKVDRASMGVGLEARVPILDHRVVEFAWSLPQHMKCRDGQSKWILRQLLYKHVPQKIMERPKMGFGVPIDHWLKGPLRDWGENLLDEKRLEEDGYFDPKPIREKWLEHQKGTRRWHYYLWDVLMFQAWQDSL